MNTYLPRDKAVRLRSVMHDCQLIMNRAEGAFNLLSRLIEDGDYEEEAHIADAAALASLALAGFAEKHEQDFLDIQKALLDHAEGGAVK